MPCRGSVRIPRAPCCFAVVYVKEALPPCCQSRMTWIEVVKRFGGWKSDAVHAYLYTDMSSAPERARKCCGRNLSCSHSNRQRPAHVMCVLGALGLSAPSSLRLRERTALEGSLSQADTYSLPFCRHGCGHSARHGPPAAAGMDAAMGQRLGLHGLGAGRHYQQGDEGLQKLVLKHWGEVPGPGKCQGDPADTDSAGPAPRRP